ncbi:MAG: molybdopterin converting factor subunit 1 [Usitatibacteraceae bacterium]
MLNVLYFASLRESLGRASESLSLPVPPNVDALIAALRARGGAWSDALADGKRWRVAVNQEMAQSDTPLKSGDEVAIFPPVTGG